MPSPDTHLNQTAPAFYTYTISTSPGFVGGPVSQGSTTTHKVDRVTTSTRTPNFRNIKKSDLPENPYHRSMYEKEDYMTTWNGYVTRISDGQATAYTYRGNVGSWGGDQSGSDVGANNPYQQAVSKVIKEIGTAKANTAVTMAEAGKTAALVAKTATRLYKSIKALKSLRFGEFAAELGVSQRRAYSRGQYHYEKDPRNFAANTWLEFSYGWKPLLNDVYNHAEAFAQQMIDHHNVIRECAQSASTRASGLTTVSPATSNWKQERLTIDKRKAVVGVRYKIPESVLNPINTFGLNNPAVVVWELVPFSFVADWFIPIGTALEAITAYNGLVFHSGFKYTIDKKTLDSNFSANGNVVTSGGFRYASTGGAKSHIEWVEIHRTPLTTFPAFGWPEFRDPRSFSHAASAIALLQSIFLHGR